MGGGGGGGGGGWLEGWPGAGGPTPRQQGGMGERCKVPHRGLGRSPKAFTFFASNTAKISVFTEQ